jgi:uncharacterized membrane protein
MNLQEAKIHAFLQLQALKRDNLEQLMDQLTAMVELKRKETVKRQLEEVAAGAGAVNGAVNGAAREERMAGAAIRG